MAHKFFSKLVLLVVAVLFVSCLSEKDRYIHKYERFATNVIENSETFTSLDWDATLAQYEQLRDEYRLHSSEMSLEERKSIDELNSKINACIIKHSTNSAIDTVKGAVNEIFGTLKELTE